MRARRIRLARLVLLGLIAAAVVVAFLVGRNPPLGGPGASGSSPASRAPVVGPSGSVVGPSGSVVGPSGSVVGPSGSVAGPSGAVSPRRGGDGFAWSYDLPADTDLERQVILGFEIWTAGQGDALRGVFMGALDVGSESVSLAIAADRLQGELGMIPGATTATEPEPVRLTAGEALRVRAQVGATSFVGYALVADGVAYRLIVAGYPDVVAEAVALSLRFQ